jgi:hypothetical protein
MATRTTDDIDPDEPEELDAMADRLEAALDRIVRHLETPRPAPADAAPRGAEPRVAELAARLDGLIERLRGVLGEPPGRPEH